MVTSEEQFWLLIAWQHTPEWKDRRYDFAARDHIQFRNADAAVVCRLQKLSRVDLPILLGRDIHFPINQADFYCLNARLAPEAFLHPVCSKVSRHAFNPHFNVFDLRLSHRHYHH